MKEGNHQNRLTIGQMIISKLQIKDSLPLRHKRPCLVIKKSNNTIDIYGSVVYNLVNVNC